MAVRDPNAIWPRRFCMLSARMKVAASLPVLVLRLEPNWTISVSRSDHRAEVLPGEVPLMAAA
jgi:hypothetical protein